MFLWNIVVTTFNSEKTLGTTLESISNLLNKESIHVIISDDCSTDSTLNIIKEWRKKENFFRDITIVDHPINLGISANHNDAINACTGDYCIYMGGDDWIYNKNLIAELDNELKENPIIIGKMNLLSVFPHNPKLDYFTFKKITSFFNKSSHEQFKILLIIGNILSGGPGTILNVQKFKDIGGFDIDIRSYEDWPLYLKYTASSFQIKFVNIEGLAWRRHSESLSWGWSDIKSDLYIKDTNKTLRKYYKTNTNNLNFIENKYIKAFLADNKYYKLLKILQINWLKYILPQKLTKKR